MILLSIKSGTMPQHIFVVQHYFKMTFLDWLGTIFVCAFWIGLACLCLGCYVRQDVIPLFIGSNIEPNENDNSTHSSDVSRKKTRFIDSDQDTSLKKD